MGDEQSKGGAFTLIEKYQEFRNKNPAPGESAGQDGEEVAEEAESEEEKGNLPDLVIDRSNFEFELPQNKQEFEKKAIKEEPKRDVSEDILQDYRDGEVAHLDGVIRELISNDNYALEDAKEKRKSLESVVSEIEENVEAENREEGYHDDWVMRLNRVLSYLELLDNFLQGQEFAPKVIKDIYLGRGDFQIPNNEAGFLNNGEGLEGTELGDTAKEFDMYSFSTTYGMAHALEDLKKINRNHLEPIVGSSEEAINERYNNLKRIKGVAREVEKSFNQLMMLRCNIEAIDDEIKVAERIAQEAEDNDWSEEIKNKVVTQQEGEKKLVNGVEELEDEELRIVKLFMRTYDVLQRDFQLDVYSVETLDEEMQRIQESEAEKITPEALFTRLRNSLQGQEGSLFNKMEEVSSEFKQLEDNVRKLRSLRLADVEDILIAQRMINNFIQTEEQYYNLEQEVEEDVDEQVQEVEQEELEIESVVNEYAAKIDERLGSAFDTYNPKSEIRDLIDFTNMAGNQITSLKDSDELDLKEDEEIEDDLEKALKEIEEIASSLSGKSKWDDEIEVEVELGDISGTYHPVEALHQVFEFLKETGNYLKDEEERKGEEKQELIALYKELEGYSNELKAVENCVRDIKELKSEFESKVSQYDSHHEQEAVMMLQEELAHEIGLNEVIQKVDGIENLVQNVKTILEKDANIERKEEQVLQEIISLEGDIDTKVNKFESLVGDHSELTSESDIVQMLEKIDSAITEVETETERLEEELSEVESDVDGAVDVFDDLDSDDTEDGDDSFGTSFDDM